MKLYGFFSIKFSCVGKIAKNCINKWMTAINNKYFILISIFMQYYVHERGMRDMPCRARSKQSPVPRPQKKVLAKAVFTQP